MSNALQYGNVPTLASLLELHQKNTMASINCHQVGEIVSFNPEQQTAEVQIKMSYKVNNNIVEYPLLIDCPCIVLSGGSGRLTLPIQAGDSCLVLFNDRDIDNWYATGQKMLARTERNHSFSDAIALVGFRNKENKITDFLSEGTELKYGNSSIKLEDNKVTVTNGTATIELSNGTVTISATNVVIDTPATSFSGSVSISGDLTVQNKDIGPNHTHSGVTTGSGITGGVN